MIDVYYFGERYCTSVLTFIKISSGYTDKDLLLSLGAKKSVHLTTKEDILSEVYPKVCLLDLDDHVCILDECNCLYASQDDNLESLIKQASTDFGEVMMIGGFWEAGNGFLFYYYNKGELIRQIYHGTDMSGYPSKVYIAKYGKGKDLKEIPLLLDYKKLPKFMSTVLTNFGIDLPKDISHGRFYQIIQEENPY